METFVLLIFMNFMQSETFGSAEFNSIESCEKAGKAYYQMVKARGYTRMKYYSYICVKK